MRTHLVPLFGLVLALVVCPTHAQAKTELWVYTSIYKEFIAPIAKAFEKKYPDIEVQVFQGGSEKLQTKIEAELAAHRPQADVVMISDPFWAAKLTSRGLVLDRKGAGSYQTNYYSLMVMIAHKTFPAELRPTRWTDLTQPRLNHLVHMGSPLESGTAFTAVAYLSGRYGWDFFDKLRENNIGCSGGNSAVIQKVESGEKKVGVVLLENALAAKKRGSPIDIIYPSDGGISIPSVQLILKQVAHPLEAAKFSDFVLSPEGQEFLLNGFMYSADKKIHPPEGAIPFDQATQGSTPWTPGRISEISEQAKQIKNKFDDLVLE